MQNALALGLVVGQIQLFSVGAVKNDLPDLRAQLFHRVTEGEMIFLGEGVEVHPGDAVTPDIVPAGSRDGAVQNGFSPIGHDEGGVGLHLTAKTHEC